MSCIILFYTINLTSFLFASLLANPLSQNWQRCRILKHHQLDVIDLAWSPDDKFLVSCSLDSKAPICVWKPMDSIASSNVLSPFKVLDVSKAHSSGAKGVSFDPIGKYLCTSADDPSLAIWRAGDDWGLECVKNSNTSIIFNSMVSDITGSTMFRRVDWTSDAKNIICTNTSDKCKKMAHLVPRDTWNDANMEHKYPKVRWIAESATTLAIIIA